MKINKVAEAVESMEIIDKQKKVLENGQRHLKRNGEKSPKRSQLIGSIMA